MFTKTQIKLISERVEKEFPSNTSQHAQMIGDWLFKASFAPGGHDTEFIMNGLTQPEPIGRVARICLEVLTD